MTASPQWGRTTKQLAAATLLILAGLLLYGFRPILPTVIIACLFAYIFAPVVGWLSTHLRIRRGLAAEVDVERATGKVTVKRLVCAQDMGLAINPQGATIQMEGCLMMGLGYALAEEIRFSGGQVLDSNFDTYEIPRFSWLPEIETVIIDAKNDPPQGGGEPAIIVVGAAIANAIFDAVGARVYRMPMTAARVKAALERAASER